MRLATWLPILLLPACDGGAFAPVEGTWTTQNEDFTEDVCELFSDPDTGEPDSVQQVIAVVDETTFTSTNDQGHTWTCTLDDLDFTCPEVLTQDEAVTGMSASLPLHVSVAGTFTDESSLSAVLSFEMSCTGEDCPGVEDFLGVTFPCTAKRAFVATADE